MTIHHCTTSHKISRKLKPHWHFEAITVKLKKYRERERNEKTKS